jgi:hypothetical protein
MIVLLGLGALAGEPDVRSLEWAQHFQWTEPHRSNMPGAAPVSEGWLVELRVDPIKARASQSAPALYAGEVAVYRTNWDDVGGCAVVIIPGPADLATTLFYFGSEALPESADPAAELRAARSQGVTPLSVSPAMTRAGTTRIVPDVRDVYAAAADRVEACSPHEKRRAQSLRGR